MKDVEHWLRYAPSSPLNLPTFIAAIQRDALEVTPERVEAAARALHANDGEALQHWTSNDYMETARAALMAALAAETRGREGTV